MQSDPTGAHAGSELRARENEWANEEPTTAWPDLAAGRLAAKERQARLARAIETDVIPRLVQARRPVAADPPPGASITTAAEVESFVGLIIHATEAEVGHTIDGLRQRGVAVESIFLDLFGPAARRLGEMWDEDACDFSTVTLALGRLQRLLRELSPAFGTEVEHPAHGRRALFVQPRDEQHSFGLSMVAEFFRRNGWDVVGGIGGAVANPQALVRNEWIDVIGFSIGSDGRLPWLSQTITAVRTASRNRSLRVLVGGPTFVARPEWALECGADGTARDGKEAPMLAERLITQSRLRKT